MAITVEWDDEAHTIVRTASQEEWDLDEFRHACLQSMALVRSVRHSVYVLSALYLNFTIPYGILWQLRDLNQLRPPNWGGGVAITRDNFAATLVSTLSQIYMQRNENRLFVVKNEVEAYEVIAKLRQQDQGL